VYKSISDTVGQWYIGREVRAEADRGREGRSSSLGSRKRCIVKIYKINSNFDFGGMRKACWSRRKLLSTVSRNGCGIVEHLNQFHG
jgi:hypothetical protein